MNKPFVPELTKDQETFLAAGAGIGDLPSLTDRIRIELALDIPCEDTLALLEEALRNIELLHLLRAQDSYKVNAHLFARSNE